MLLSLEIVVDLVMLVEVESMMDAADTALLVGVLIEFEIILTLLEILPIQEHITNQLVRIHTCSMSISARNNHLLNTIAIYILICASMVILKCSTVAASWLMLL